MAWILLIISLFIHTLSAYAMGDIVVHALQYEVTKGVIFGNVAILLGCILVRLFLDKFLVSTNAGKHGTAGVDSVVYIIGTVFAAVLLELDFSYEMPQSLVMTLLLLDLMIMAEKDLYLGIFIEEENAANDHPDLQIEEDDEDEEVPAFIDPAPAEKQDEDDESVEDGDDDEVVLTFIDPAPAENQDEDDEEDGLVFIDPVPTEKGAKPATDEPEETPGDQQTVSGTENDQEQVVTGTEVKVYSPGSGMVSEKLTSRDIVYIIFFAVGCLAFITLGIFVLITPRLEDSHYGLFAGMGIAIATAVIFRQLGRGLAPEEMDEMDLVDRDSQEYWEARDRAEAAWRKSIKVNGILFGILTILMTVLLCFASAFIGFVYLLGAFLVAVIIPMCFYRWGIGGTDIVHAWTERISRLVSRVFMVIILLIATWQLSYGALWEVEYLLILAVTCVTQDYLTRQNR